MNLIKLFTFFFIFYFFCSTSHAEIYQVKSIQIDGIKKIETEVITSILSQKVGKHLNHEDIKKDIKKIYALGHFYSVKVYKEKSTDGISLIYRLKEKPSIVEIRFEGLEELKKDDFKDVLETKLYSIINEGTLSSDLRKIEQKYTEKGFYLASLDYKIEEKNKNEAIVIITVKEKKPLLVGSISLHGNKHFSDTNLLEQFASKPFTRPSFLSSSFFQEKFIKRDREFLIYLYKNAGFAKIKVGEPIIQISTDQSFVDITINIEEGLQYKVSEIKFSGEIEDEPIAKKTILEKNTLKSGDVFSYVNFVKNIEYINSAFGDQGYSYVDVNPDINFNDLKKTVSINYIVTKGKQAYFGEIKITGNTKTRDNVIRREFEVNEGELYSGSGLSNSKKNIQRLGFFEEVKILKERDTKNPNIVNLKTIVKEAPTGQAQMSFGFSPAGVRDASWFGQTKYTEKNQSGKGWNTSLSGKYANSNDYDLEAGFVEPRILNGDWSLGVSGAYRSFTHRYFTNLEVPEKQQSVSLMIGKRIYELITLNISIKHSQIQQLEDTFIFEEFKASGIKNSLSFGFLRRDLDNYLDPRSGTFISANHKIFGSFTGGDFHFMESNLDVKYYFPIDFSNNYQTHFKFQLSLGKLWGIEGKTIPVVERYSLGGFNDLRGYDYKTIGPKEKRLRSPLGLYSDFNIGGDRKILFQVEYYIPVIAKAGIRALLFADAGNAFLENEDIDLTNLAKDVGFGFRWKTPVAPFRFEWAFPYLEDKQAFGDMKFIFTLGN